jgi:hypothetical protein
MRYEAYFFEGEPEERLPSWRVVDNETGKKIGEFYYDTPMSQESAETLAYTLNYEHSFGDKND